MRAVTTDIRAILMLLSVLLLAGCSSEENQADRPGISSTRDDTETPAPTPTPDNETPITRPVLPPGLDPAGTITTTTADLTTSTASASATTATVVRAATPPTTASIAQTTATRVYPDVGYEGLARSIGNIERGLMPYFTNRDTRISPQVAEQITRQTDTYITEIKNARSVDKDMRNEIRDMAIDVHSAVREMGHLPPGERYDFLRSLTQRRIEEIQAQMLEESPASGPE